MTNVTYTLLSTRNNRASTGGNISSGTRSTIWVIACRQQCRQRRFSQHSGLRLPLYKFNKIRWNWWTTLSGKLTALMQEIGSKQLAAGTLSNYQTTISRFQEFCAVHDSMDTFIQTLQRKWLYTTWWI